MCNLYWKRLESTNEEKRGYLWVGTDAVGMECNTIACLPYG